MREPQGGAGFCAAGVRAHYTGLAPAYGRRANAACARACAALIRRVLAGCANVLEAGAGCCGHLGELPAVRRVACDFSLPMLRAQRGALAWTRVVADAQALPFRDGTFDGVCAVNLLEHVPDPARLLREAARVLAVGGRLVAVTPNGDLGRLLELLERLRLKLPEGPHRFLGFAELGRLAAAPPFRVLEHRRFLAFPAGPAALVAAVDRLAAGRGLFQYAVLERVAR